MTRTYSADDLKAMSPVEYAKERNAEINAQAKAEGWQFWTTIPEDPKFFEEAGFETAYDYLKSSLFDELSDTYKEIHGIRPRGLYCLSQMTLEDIEGEIKELVNYDKMIAAEAKKQEEESRTAAAPLTYSPFAVLKSLS